MGGISSFAGNLTGGLIGTSDAEIAAGKADKISEEAKQKILGELGDSWGEIEGWLNPYLEAGTDALDKYKMATGMAPDAPVFEGFDFDFTKMEQNPAYQFVRDQGLQAVDRLQAANRGLGSGNRMTAITDYATGLAGQEYGNEFARQMQAYKANQGAQAMSFDAANTKYGTDMSNLGYLTTMGSNTAGNLSTLRERLATSRSGAYSNRAAEATAAALIPAQEKMSFVNNLIATGGKIAGASAGN